MEVMEVAMVDGDAVLSVVVDERRPSSVVVVSMNDTIEKNKYQGSFPVRSSCVRGAVNAALAQVLM